MWLSWIDIQAIITIIFLEGLLSVDNALVNASIANKLPEHRRKKAIMFGIGAGAILRVVALLGASFIIKHEWARLLGGSYLIYLGIKHLFFDHPQKDDNLGQSGKDRFFDVIIAIAFADIAFSLDNVIAAVGMSSKFYIVLIGVLAGIVAMLFATQLIAKLIRRYPLLEKTAYLIVGFIGLTIFAEIIFNFPIDETRKFLAVISAIAITIAIEESRIRRAKSGR